MSPGSARRAVGRGAGGLGRSIGGAGWTATGPDGGGGGVRASGQRPRAKIKEQGRRRLRHARPPTRERPRNLHRSPRPRMHEGRSACRLSLPRKVLDLSRQEAESVTGQTILKTFGRSTAVCPLGVQGLPEPTFGEVAPGLKRAPQDRVCPGDRGGCAFFRSVDTTT